MIETLENLEGKEVKITSLLKAAGLGNDEISIIETEGMYPYKDKVENNWAYYTAVGMKHFSEILKKEGRVPENVGIVGICSGVEAIAIARIFDSQMKNLIVTDIDSGILKGTIYNLSNTIKNKNLKITPVVGSFCEPMKKTGIKMEFVHGNIPNLPASGSEDLTKGAEKGTFLMVGTYEGYHPPKELLGWALGAQYAFLQSAKPVLAPGGSLITELGGRMPISAVKRLFELCDMDMQEIIVGFKEQTEALIDFEGYHRLEEQYGTEFEFYLYEESKKVLDEKRISNPSPDISGEEVKELIRPFKINAGEAIKMFHKKIAVGHTVHLFRGVNKE